MANEQYFSEAELKILLALAEEEIEYLIEEDEEIFLPGTSSYQMQQQGIQKELSEKSTKAHQLSLLTAISEKISKMVKGIEKSKENKKTIN